MVYEQGWLTLQWHSSTECKSPEGSRPGGRYNHDRPGRCAQVEGGGARGERGDFSFIVGKSVRRRL